MRTLFSLSLVLLLAVGLTLILREDNGYVYLAYGHWTLETSLAIFLSLNLLAWLALAGLTRLRRWLWQLPQELRHWRLETQERRSLQSLYQGALAYGVHDWERARELWVREAEHSRLPALHYLHAARAAHQAGAPRERDLYLQLAAQSTPVPDIRLALMRAEMLLDSGQHETALSLLQQLKSAERQHPWALQLQAQALRITGSWETLLELWPNLKRRNALSATALETLELELVSHLLETKTTLQELTGFWRSLPSELRRLAANRELFCRRLAAVGDSAAAAAQIIQFVNDRWDSGLLLLLAQLPLEYPGKLLNQVEQWLIRTDESPELLLALGSLAFQNRLWGKARNYLDRLLRHHGEDPRAYWLLGQIAAATGDRASSEYFQKGMALILKPTCSARTQAP